MTDKKIGATQTIGKMDRRKFLQTTAVGSIAGLGATTTSFAVTESHSNIKWDREADIVVVGSGAAASVSAIAAVHANSSVIIVEKAPIYGGTTLNPRALFGFQTTDSFERKALRIPVMMPSVTWLAVRMFSSIVLGSLVWVCRSWNTTCWRPSTTMRPRQ